MQKNVKQESQEILRQQRHGQMLLALIKIVLQMIPFGFGRIVVFILTLPCHLYFGVNGRAFTRCLSAAPPSPNINETISARTVREKLVSEVGYTESESPSRQEKTWP